MSHMMMINKCTKIIKALAINDTENIKIVFKERSNEENYLSN